MKTVKLLEEQNESLCETLMQKDREISEYMLEKGDTISKSTAFLVNNALNEIN